MVLALAVLPITVFYEVSVRLKFQSMREPQSNRIGYFHENVLNAF